MTDVARVSDKAGLPGPIGWDRDTLNSKPRNPTKRPTRPLLLLHTT